MTRKNLYNFFEYGLALCLVLNCRTMWTAMVGITEKFILLLIGMEYFCVIGCILSQKYFKYKDYSNGIIITFVCVAYFVLYAFLINIKQLAVLKFTAGLAPLIMYYFLCARVRSVNELAIKIKNVVAIIAVVSLFFWFFGSLLHILKPSHIVYSTWSGSGMINKVPSYHNLYFEAQSTDSLFGGMVLPRNTALFTEGPMSSYIFNMALIVQLFIEPKKNKKVTILLIIAALSTFTTLGIVLATAELFAKYLTKEGNGSLVRFVRIAMIPTITILICIFSYMMIKNRMSSNSARVRIDDFIVGFRAWKSAPFLGIGYNNGEGLKHFMESWRGTNKGFSNSPMMILACGGLFFGLPYIICIIRCLFNALIRCGKEYRYFILFFLILSTVTVVPYQWIHIYFLISLQHFGNKNCSDSKQEILNKFKGEIYN